MKIQIALAALALAAQPSCIGPVHDGRGQDRDGRRRRPDLRRFDPIVSASRRLIGGDAAD